MSKEKISICHICSYYATPVFSDLVRHQLDFSIPRVFYYQHFKYNFENGNEYFVDKCPCYNYIDRFNFFVKQGKAIKAYKSIYSPNTFQLNFSHSLFTNGYIAYHIQKEWDVPYIVAIQNTDLNFFFKYIKVLNKIGIDILLKSERIILASESYKIILLKKYIPLKYQEQLRKKMIVIPYGINDFYSQNLYNYNKELTNTIKLLVVGRINKNKNQLLLCEAIKKVKYITKSKQIELTIIGEEVNKKILNKIKSYPFIKYIEPLKKEELICQYRNADIFILASKTETFGLVYAEALSQGLPIIYTEGQGFDMQFPEGIVGFHTKLNVKDIIFNIEKVIFHYPVLQKRCSNASKKFAWDSINIQYKIIYDAILKA